jgi:uncharacterized protein (TIGR02246 family)
MILRAARAFVICCGCVLPLSTPALAEVTAPPEAVQQEIRKAAVAFVEAFNRKDAKALSGLFAEQARYEDAQGHVVLGREAIEQAFAKSFQEEPQAKLSIEVESLRMLTPEVVVEQGFSEFFPDGKTFTSRARYLVLHLKEQDQWRMVSVRTMEEEFVSHYEMLRGLEWLVGDWVDESAEAVVETSGRWDEKKNFLLLDIKVKRRGVAVQTGSQRIGWDPQTKQIRGWTFDSQGGFGETCWQPVEEGWQVRLTGVSGDGESVSAVRHFSMRDPAHIVVNTTDRTRGGATLADIQIVMVRKAPSPAAAE